VGDPRASLILELKDLATKSLTKLGGSLDKIAKNAEQAKFAFGAMAAGIGLLGTKALKTAGAFEQWKVSFTTMLGSAEKADKLLAKVRDFAAKTPFDLPQVVEGSKRLLAFGIAADDIIPTMKSLGDISAGLSVPMSRLVNVFGQVRAAGRLMGQEVLQFTNAGVPILEMLAEKFGKTTGEIKKLVEKGGVGFEDVRQVLFEASQEGGKFYDLMKKQNKTFLGSLSELSDMFTEIFLALGDKLLPMAKELVQVLIKAAEATRDFVQANSTLVISVLALTGAMSGLLFVFGATVALTPTFAAALGTILGLVNLLHKAFLSMALALAINTAGFTAFNTVLVITISSIGAIAIAVGGLTFAYIKLSAAVRASNEAQESALEKQKRVKKETEEGWRVLKKYQGMTTEQAKASGDLATVYEELTRGVRGLNVQMSLLSDPAKREAIKAQMESLKALRDSLGFTPGGDGAEGPGISDKEKEALKEKADRELEQATLTNEALRDLDLSRLEDKLRNLGMIEEAEKIADVRFLESQKNRIKSEQELQRDRVKAGKAALNALASLQNSKNKEMAAVGKAAAITQTTIDTYVGATAAYKALAGIPVVGPYLGAAAAAAAITAGLADVARISAVPLAAGGVALPTQGGTLAQVAEAGSREAILPLDDPQALEGIREALGGSGGGNHYHIGTLIADDMSLREFARKMDEEFFRMETNRERASG